MPNQEMMLRELLFQALLNHPLPWRIEQDWTYEVTASDDYIIAKCRTRQEAEEFISFAEKFWQQVQEEGEVVERELGLLDQE